MRHFKRRKPSVIILVILVIIFGLYIATKKNSPEQRSIVDKVADRIDLNKDTNKTITPAPGVVELDVPFTTQSPLVHWSDPEEDAACEEASLVMAWHWIQGDTTVKLDPNTANDEIHKIIDFEKQHYGNSIDTSAEDTAITFKDYYQTDKMTVKQNIALDDILAELAAGHLVIVPTNGNALGNPNFQHPGPETHMIVIRGYDSNKKEFIVNDPGTRKGMNYVYTYDVLYNAIRDYPTGNHLPITGNSKVMLVVVK